MIEASFEAVTPKAINAEFEAIIPREKAFDIVNKDIHIDTNGKYEVKADAGTAMTQVNVEVDIQPKEFKDVNFYDYEGTILHSYTWDEFVEKNEMPPLPTHREKEGLVCQEWNYTLDEVLEQGGRCDVGAIYIPEDGNTHIVIKTVRENTIVKIYYNKSTNTTIAWGDGTQEKISDTTSASIISHTYTNIGEYDIVVITDSFNFRRSDDLSSISPIQLVRKVVMAKNAVFGGGSFDGASNIKGAVINDIQLPTHIFYGSSITHINIVGKKTLSSLPFRESSIRSISIPNKCVLSGPFQMASNVRYFHIPNNATYTGSMRVGNLEKLSVGTLNKSVKLLDYNVVNTDNTVLIGFNGILGEGIKKIGDYAFYNSTITKLSLPNSLESLGNSSFYACRVICNGVSIPKNIKNIPASTFYNCIDIPYFDFRNHEVVPTLANTNAFTSISTTCKIVVPDALYDEWIVATNWATYKSRIVKASEFVEPTNE